MKNILSLLLIGFFFCFAKCNKEDPGLTSLPPATQEGRNTLGFMLNGKPWTPKGFNGRANLSIDVDLGFNKGIFSISAYRILSSTDRQYFGIGLKDSLSFITTYQTYQLGNGTLYGVYFSQNGCTLDYFDNVIYSSGSLTITKLDKTNRIIAGTFNAKLYKTGCNDTIRITEGRFDMKF